MSVVMITEPVAIKMVDRKQGDLFVVCLSDRSLIVRMIEPLPDADRAMNAVVPGVFAVTEDKPEELWLRLCTHGTFTRCQYLSYEPACPICGSTMKVVGEQFVCTFCKGKQLVSK